MYTYSLEKMLESKSEDSNTYYAATKYGPIFVIWEHFLPQVFA
jgi:hypothetical protein